MLASKDASVILLQGSCQAFDQANDERNPCVLSLNSQCILLTNDSAVRSRNRALTLAWLVWPCQHHCQTIETSSLFLV